MFLHGWSSPLALSASYIDAGMEECNLIQSAARYVERLAAETFGELVSTGQIVSVETWFAAIHKLYSFSCLDSYSIIFHHLCYQITYHLFHHRIPSFFGFLNHFFVPRCPTVSIFALQEWWAHSRPSGSGSGHQLHYDLDEVDLKTLKVRIFLLCQKVSKGTVSFAYPLVSIFRTDPSENAFFFGGPRHLPHQSTQSFQV